jgi:hypothetical protein
LHSPAHLGLFSALHPYPRFPRDFNAANFEFLRASPCICIFLKDLVESSRALARIYGFLKDLSILGRVFGPIWRNSPVIRVF